MKIEKSPFRKIWDSKLICKIEAKYPRHYRKAWFQFLVEKDHLLERFSPELNDLVYNKEKRTKGVKRTLYYIWVRFSFKNYKKKINLTLLSSWPGMSRHFFSLLQKTGESDPRFFFINVVLLYFMSKRQWTLGVKIPDFYGLKPLNCIHF